jgi:parallel beta-helix repeat protein
LIISFRNYYSLLKTLEMKNNPLVLAALLGILVSGCSKNEEPSLQLATRPQEIKMPSWAGIEFIRPDVPPYDGNLSTDSESRGVTTVPPGTNQLQAIINSAPNNETIKLLPGIHTEDATLVINHKIKLTGAPGAVLSLGGLVGLLVSGANGTQVTNLEVVNNAGSVVAVVVENSSQVQIKVNEISGFAFSVALEQADHASVTNNSIAGTGEGHGVTVINGDFANVSGNDISNNFFGIWACDRQGTCTNNTVQNNVVGIILCKATAVDFPSGITGGSEMQGNNWLITNNTATGNGWGYLVIDGAFENTLSNNAGAGNTTDMELAGETNLLFGMFTPTSANNTVNVGGSSMDVIDCGLNNVVHGTTPLAGPCSI